MWRMENNQNLPGLQELPVPVLFLYFLVQHLFVHTTMIKITTTTTAINMINTTKMFNPKRAQVTKKDGLYFFMMLL